VMMMAAAAAESIVKATVVQEHPADGAGLSQELHCSKDRGAAYPRYLAQDVIHTEMAAPLHDGCRYRQSRRCQAMALVLEPP